MQTQNPDTLSRLLSHWRSAGVKLRPPASLQEIEAFERRAGVRLPNDMRDYLLLADGMEEFDMDADLFSFWQLSRIVPISVLLPEPHYEAYRNVPDAHHCFCFADWSINADVYSIHLSSDASKPIRFSGLGPRYLPFTSFTEFVEAYFKDANGSLI